MMEPNQTEYGVAMSVEQKKNFEQAKSNGKAILHDPLPEFVEESFGPGELTVSATIQPTVIW